MGRAGLRKGRRARVAVSAAVAVVMLGGAAARWSAAGTWARDPATVGDWFTAANWQEGYVPTSGGSAVVNNGGTAQVATGTVAVNDLHLGSTPGGSGTLSVTGGTLAWSYGNAYVGESGVGRLVQTGGRVNDPPTFGPPYYNPGLLYVGYNSGATGTYELGGTGRLGPSSPSGSGWHDEYIGYSGRGSFLQTGGTHYLSGNSMYLGYNGGAAGVYALSGGALYGVQSASVYLGYSGGGRFLQSGGMFGVLSSSPSLYVGYVNGFGRYELSGGTISGVMETVGFGSGAGFFGQSGGSNAATSLSVGSRGRYALAGGTLTAWSTSVGGTMSQTGGTASAGGLTVGTGGRYELSGGSLSVTNLRNDGVLAFGSPGVTMSAGGLVDFAHGALVNPQNASVTIQPGSLVVVPAGFDPAAAFGTFANQGTVHVAGTALGVGPGQTFAGVGVIDDFVDINGGTMSGRIDYRSGISARGAAGVFNGGAVTVEGPTASGVADTAQVTFTAVTIAATSGVGTFVQSGGQNNAGRLVVESGGRYVLSGGTLAVTSGLESRGVIDLAGGGGTVSVNGGIADFTQGSLVNTSQGTLTTASSSLVLLPAGANPAAMFKGVTTQGLVHAAGTPLAIPAGRSIAGPGTIADHVDVAGTLSGSVTLLGGVAISGTGSVTAGTVRVGDTTSGISGGSLAVTDARVLAGGTFTQSAGSLSGSSLTVAGRYALAGGQVSPTYFRVRDGGTAVQTGGTNSAFYKYVGDTAGGTGSYALSNGTMSGASAYVGYSGGTGTFTQAGGTNSITTYLGTGSAGSTGTYALSGGTQSGTMYVGDDEGVGTVVQTGGTKTGSVYLGYGAGSGGTYQLGAGQLSPGGSMYVGYRGTGAVVQTGGTMSSSSTINLGYQSGASGTYELQGGTLSAGSVAVGSSGTGTFVQSGGTSTLSGTLSVATGSAATGRYELSGGALTAPTQTIGTSKAVEAAVFVQTGGSNAANALTVNPSGRYAMGGGTLSVAQGIMNSGVVDFGGGAVGPGVSLGGVTDFTQGTWLNLGQANVTGLAGSLIIVPAGFDVTTGFKAFASGGLTHVAGTPLAIGAGESYSWGGTIGDRVDVAGSVAGGVTNRPLQLTGGVTVAGAGSLTSVTVRVNGTGSGISGGQITSGTLYVGDAGAGTFEQTGGTCAPSSLIVGNLAGSAGSYVLSAGTLTGTAQSIGGAGAGTLSQSGGTNTAGTLVVGGQGVYRLSGGSLTVTSGMTLRGTLDLAGSAAGVTLRGITDWTAGSVVGAGQATLTTGAGSLLIVPAGFDPASRFGTFAAGGMVHTLGTTLDVPAGKSVIGSGAIADPALVGGTMSSSGSLTFMSGLTVGTGARAVASGTLTVNGTVAVGTGGTLSASGTFGALCVGSGGSATMTLTGGLASSASREIVGDGAGDSGTVSQSGGTNAVATWLYIGNGAGSQGRYMLSGGDVVARPTSSFSSSGGIVYVGSGGQGTFVQTGGRVLADSGSSTLFAFPASAGLAMGALSGGSGTYEMDGGELTVDAEWIGAQVAFSASSPAASGGTGVLLQRGGTHTVRNKMAVRGASVVDVAGGTLSVGTLDIAGNAATLAFELNGPAGAMGFAVSAMDATVDGSLHVRLGAGFDPAAASAADQFLLLDTYAVIDGAFDNVPSGSRLVTDDGRGSFVVSYGLGSPFGADRLVLSGFQVVPEPAGVGFVVSGVAVMGWRRRRRL